MNKPKEFTRYLGGDKRESNQNLPVTHLAVAFQTPGVGHPDANKLRMLEQLLGVHKKWVAYGVRVSYSLRGSER